MSEGHLTHNLQNPKTKCKSIHDVHEGIKSLKGIVGVKYLKAMAVDRALY